MDDLTARLPDKELAAELRLEAHRASLSEDESQVVGGLGQNGCLTPLGWREERPRSAQGRIGKP